MQINAQLPEKHNHLQITAKSIQTVCGQNTKGIYITPLVLIQPTDVEQNAVKNNWLLKLQPAKIQLSPNRIRPADL